MTGCLLYKQHQQQAWHSLQMWDWNVPSPKSLTWSWRTLEEEKRVIYVLSCLFHEQRVFVSMQAFCYYLESVCTDAQLSLPPALSVHHWIKFPVQTDTEMLPSSKVLFCWFSSHDPTTEFVGENVRHRSLTPTHLQVPWILIDLLCSCLPDLIHCYLFCGKLLQPPFPSSRLWAKHLSIQTWLTAAAAMCKAE